MAVAIPAYNEADGIVEFVRELDRVLGPLADPLTLVVVDDASTDDTVERLTALAPDLSAQLDLIRQPRNQGHGPTVLAAYQRALELNPQYVLQVDGDGQFAGSDLRRALVLLIDEAHAVCGVRRFRHDPWFRMVMTRLLRVYVRSAFGVIARDANCPLRGYEAPLLGDLLADLPQPCLIPNLYLTVIASRRGLALLEVDVSHRVRRGGSASGTTWGAGRSPIPWRLVRFSTAALAESRRMRARLRAIQKSGER